MGEVTTAEAAEILSTTQRTIQRRVDDGHLQARRQGLKQTAFIDLDTLRAFAKEYGYRFDEAKASELAQ